MSLILGVDPAWKGTAWVLVHHGIPVAWGHRVLNDPHRRFKLRDLLAEVDAAAAVEAMQPHASGRPRLAIEEVPKRYRGNKGDKFSASRVQMTIRGLASIQGAVTQHFVRPGWDAPWEVPTEEWRGWHGLRDGMGRDALKRLGVAIVRDRWPQVLRGLDLEPPPVKPGETAPAWPAGDMADACLIGVGASRHLADAPANPRGWR
jgi:hypothetical protein